MTVETLVAVCRRMAPQLEWVGDAATLPYDAAEGFERSGSGLRAVVTVCHDPGSGLTFAEVRQKGRRAFTYRPEDVPALLGLSTEHGDCPARAAA